MTVADTIEQILSAFYRHYTGHFGMSAPTADTDAVDNLNLMSVLDVDERSLVDGLLRLCEIEHAIDSLTRGKTPGPDEIGAEFYKIDKDRLALLPLRIFQNAKRSDDDVLRRLDGYRPIALCNVGYKIFCKSFNGVTSISGPILSGRTLNLWQSWQVLADEYPCCSLAY